MKDLSNYCRKLLEDKGRIGFDSKDNPFVIIVVTGEEKADKLKEDIYKDTGIEGSIVGRNKTDFGIQFFTLKAKCLLYWLYSLNESLPQEVKEILDWRPRKVFPGTVSEQMEILFQDIIEDVSEETAPYKTTTPIIPHVLDLDITDCSGWLSSNHSSVEEEVEVKLGFWSAWKELKKTDRRIILWLLAGQTPNQIAESLKINYAYTRVIISNARKKFQDLLENQGVFL